jgi:DNA helicase II / ATP-dependent DNA helicase PcrA
VSILLSQEQARAVASESSAVIVVASAGSGKTEVLAHRIERLLLESEDEGYRVLAVTYTVRAADELRERLVSRLGNLHRRVDADTIHGFALSLLRQHGTRIGLPPEPEILSRDADRFELLDSWLTQSGMSWPDDPARVFAQIDLARARCQSADLLDEWRQALDASGSLDFAAMLDRASELLEGPWLSRHLRRIYRHIVVDEAQNLSLAQYRFIKGLIGDPSSDHLCAVLVGDERQSIVGFAGADSELISRFAQDYSAERIELHTNYRSARRIVNVGLVVAKALGHPAEVMEHVEFPALGSVEIQKCKTEDEEAGFVASWVAELLSHGLDPKIVAPGEPRIVQAEDIAVLARAASSLRFVREALGDIGINSASGSTEDDWVTSTAGRVVVEVIAYKGAPEHMSTRRRLAQLCGSDKSDWPDLSILLQSASSPSVAHLSRLSDVSTVNDMLSIIPHLDVEEIDWPDDLIQLQYAWETFADRTHVAERTFGNFRQHIVRCQRGDALEPGVRLLTVHRSQGREFRAVALVACNDGQFPDFRARASEDLAAELRTFYVAVSRASRRLLISRSEERITRYGSRPTEPSRFLNYV